MKLIARCMICHRRGWEIVSRRQKRGKVRDSNHAVAIVARANQLFRHFHGCNANLVDG